MKALFVIFLSHFLILNSVSCSAESDGGDERISIRPTGESVKKKCSKKKVFRKRRTKKKSSITLNSKTKKKPTEKPSYVDDADSGESFLEIEIVKKSAETSVSLYDGSSNVSSTEPKSTKKPLETRTVFDDRPDVVDSQDDYSSEPDSDDSVGELTRQNEVVTSDE